MYASSIIGSDGKTFDQAVLKDAYPVWQDAQKKTVGAMGSGSRDVLDGLLSQVECLAAA